MTRLAVAALLLFSLTACGSDPEVDVAAAEAEKRCTEAKELHEDITAQWTTQEKETPDASAKFYAALDRGEIDEVGYGIAFGQQYAFQIVSDNPTCFPVGAVTDARNALKMLDPAITRALTLLAANPELGDSVDDTDSEEP